MREQYPANITNHLSDLSAAVDVYSDWVDACDAVAKESANQYDGAVSSQMASSKQSAPAIAEADEDEYWFHFMEGKRGRMAHDLGIDSMKVIPGASINSSSITFADARYNTPNMNETQSTFFLVKRDIEVLLAE